MSRNGWPSLGPEYTGFLHRHPPKPGRPEMKKHVVVDLEDWKLARQQNKEENSNSAELKKQFKKYCQYSGVTKTTKGHYEMPTWLFSLICDHFNSLPCGETNTSSPKLPNIKECENAILKREQLTETQWRYFVDGCRKMYNFIAGKIGR